MRYVSIEELSQGGNRPLLVDGVEPGPAPGNIRLRATANCGNCADWEDAIYPTKTAAARYIRGRGWRLTKTKGWLCPKCVGL